MPVEEQTLRIVDKSVVPWIYLVVYTTNKLTRETAVGNQIIQRLSPIRTADDFSGLTEYLDAHLVNAIGAVPGASVITNLVLLHRDAA